MNATEVAFKKKTVYELYYVFGFDLDLFLVYLSK